MNQKCVLCKNNNPGIFIQDTQTDDIICSICGAVQPVINPYSGAGVFVEAPEYRVPNASERDFLKLNDQMMTRVCPKEARVDNRDRIIREYCERLDLAENVEMRTKLFFEKYSDELESVRPHNNTIAACIAVACQSLNLYINVTRIEERLSLSNVGKTLTTICKIVGINQRAVILNSVPFLVSMLGFPFKYEKKLKNLYRKACRRNPSMGSETRMALCCYRLYLDNMEKSRAKGRVKLSLIARITNTSEGSLKAYISGKSKNCLFQK